MNKEVRKLTNTIEVRSEQDSSENIIVGYALKFNSWSENLGGFRERISPDSLDGTDMSDVRALIDHNSSQIIGRSKVGTLKLEVDDIGLKFRCQLPNTTYANDLMENLRNGNINQCSFAFQIDEDGEDIEYNDTLNIYDRTIKRIKSLFDVSVVTYPAYSNTDVQPALRSIEKIEEQLEREKMALKLNLI